MTSFFKSYVKRIRKINDCFLVKHNKKVYTKIDQQNLSLIIKKRLIRFTFNDLMLLYFEQDNIL